MSPVKCPPDAFCPAGSAGPAYCMEVFLYKVGDSCQLTPLTVILLAVFSAGECWLVFGLLVKPDTPLKPGAFVLCQQCSLDGVSAISGNPDFEYRSSWLLSMPVTLLAPFPRRDIAAFALKEGQHDAEGLWFVLGKQVCVWTPKPGISCLPRSRKKDNFLLARDYKVPESVPAPQPCRSIQQDRVLSARAEVVVSMLS